MRKFLFILFIVINSHSYAQVDAGTMIAGGGMSFNHRIQNNFNSTTFNLTPQWGITLFDNFLVGAWFNMGLGQNITSWSVSPFVRYYYYKNLFFQGGYGYSYMKSGDFDSSGSIIDLELGYAAFLTDNVALEPALYYNGTFSGGGYSATDLGFKIGFQVYFNR
jgi:hypothetical protein